MTSTDNSYAICQNLVTRIFEIFEIFTYLESGDQYKHADMRYIIIGDLFMEIVCLLYVKTWYLQTIFTINICQNLVSAIFG